MAVGIERNESAAEIQVGRGLQDPQPAPGPIRMGGIDRVRRIQREDDLGAATRGRRRRLHRMARPEAELEAVVEHEQDEGGRAFDRLTAEQRAVEGAAPLRLVDIEDDEIRGCHELLSKVQLFDLANIGQATVRFWQ